MTDDKKPITTFVGLCIVVLLVVFIAGCTSASATASPTAIAAAPERATATTQSSNVVLKFMRCANT